MAPCKCAPFWLDILWKLQKKRPFFVKKQDSRTGTALNTEQRVSLSGAHVAYENNGLIQTKKTAAAYFDAVIKTGQQCAGLSVKQKLTGHCRTRRLSDEQ